MLLLVAEDREIEPFGECVDHRHADAVQPARYLIGIVVGRILELPARVELGHDHFGGGDALFGVNAGRDAATIILYRDRAIGVERDVDPVAMPGERFVDRVVGNLEHHMVEARSVVGIADIHAGAFADRVEALEHLDRIGAIVVGIGVFCHSEHIGIRLPERKQNGERGCAPPFIAGMAVCRYPCPFIIRKPGARW